LRARQGHQTWKVEFAGNAAVARGPARAGRAAGKEAQSREGRGQMTDD